MSYAASLDFSLFQIKLFLTVAEEHSFSRAAEFMHVEQSTLSRRIAVLEQELGFSLFNRDCRPIQVTRRGQTLYEQWKPLVAAFEHSLSLVYTQRDENTSTLGICMVDSCVYQSDAPSLSKQMRELFPDVTLLFHYAAMSQWEQVLTDGLADITITVAFDAEDVGDRFSVNRIISVPKLACVLNSNPLSQKDHITYHDLHDQKFITLVDSENPRHAGYIRRICAEHGFIPQFGTRSLNAHGLTSALQNSDEVLVCDRFLRGLDNPNFKLFELPQTYSGLCSVFLKDNPNPYIKPFVALMQSYYGAQET